MTSDGIVWLVVPCPGCGSFNASVENLLEGCVWCGCIRERLEKPEV